MMAVQASSGPSRLPGFVPGFVRQGPSRVCNACRRHSFHLLIFLSCPGSTDVKCNVRQAFSGLFFGLAIKGYLVKAFKDIRDKGSEAKTNQSQIEPILITLKCLTAIYQGDMLSTYEQSLGVNHESYCNRPGTRYRSD